MDVDCFGWKPNSESSRANATFLAVGCGLNEAMREQVDSDGNDFGEIIDTRDSNSQFGHLLLEGHNRLNANQANAEPRSP
jgi:hypothetical protein